MQINLFFPLVNYLLLLTSNLNLRFINIEGISGDIRRRLSSPKIIHFVLENQRTQLSGKIHDTQACRLLTNPDSPCARVLKVKYYPNSVAMPPQPGLQLHMV
jgi:hypothetical protein